MPTYEYKCPNGHLFEKTFPRISNQRFAKCPKCGKRSKRQIWGGGGLGLKGSGFYATDYKRPAGRSEKAARTAEKQQKDEKHGARQTAKKKPGTDTDKLRR